MSLRNRYPFGRAGNTLLSLLLVCLPYLLSAQAPTSLSYPSPNVYISNVSNVYLAPTVSGTVTTYTVSPTLPSGLSIAAGTGVITGVPSATTAGPVAYTVTATNGSGNTTATFSLNVTSNVFNNNGNLLNFGGAGTTVENKIGNGQAVGDIVVFRNVTTLSGQAIDCIVKTVEVTTGTTWYAYDQALTTDNSTFSSNDPAFFSPQVNFPAGGGNLRFDFQFILGGTYSTVTQSGNLAVLQNVFINTYDIDGNGNNLSNQVAQFGGFTTSEIGSGNTSTLTPGYNTSTNLTSYTSNTSVNRTNVTSDSTRVRLTYNNISDFSIAMSAGANGRAYFFTDFSAGPAFSSTPTSPPSIDLNTATAGNGNGATGCSAALNFTAAGQTNITSGTATLNGFVFTFPETSIPDGANERFLLALATAGGTIPLNFTNAQAIPSVTHNGITYNVTAAVTTTLPSNIRTLTFTRATGTLTLAEAEALLDAMQYSNNASTPTLGTRSFRVSVRNSAYASPVATFQPTLNCVSVSGNIFHDANGLSDNTVNANGTPAIPTTVYAVLVNRTTNLAVGSQAVTSGNTAYTFGRTDPGNYGIYLSTSNVTGGTSVNFATVVPSYPSATTGTYRSVGENLGAAAGNDLLVDGKISFTLGSLNASNVNLGIQIPPTTTASSFSGLANPGNFNAYTVPNTSFIRADEDGSIASITITSFPTGANYLRVDNIYYTAPGSTCPLQTTCTTWPGTLTIPVTGGTISQTIGVDPTASGATSIQIPFTVTDNGGLSTTTPVNVTLGFVAPALTVSGNVWNDVNGDGINASPEVLTAAASNGQTLYAVLVQTNNTYSTQATIYAATVVSATTGYSFPEVASGNSYEVRIVSAGTAPLSGAAASTITPALATNYVATRTNNNGTISGLLNSQDPAITLPNLTASAANANFGIEQRPATGSATVSNIPNPGGFNAYTVADASFIRSDADGGTVQSITITAFPTGANYIRIGTTYYTGAGSTCPPQAGTCTAFPGAGVTIPVSGTTLSQTVTVDPSAAGVATVTIPYTALDNAGISSTPATNLTLNFVASSITVSGNVWNDVNGDGINASPEVLTNAAISGQTLYAVLVQTSNTYSNQATILESVAVNATTGYNFSNVPSGNGYEVGIVSAGAAPTAGALATTITPALATNYTATRTSNNGTISGLLNSQNPAISFGTLTASAANANFGIEQRPTNGSTTTSNLANPGGFNAYTIPDASFVRADADGGTVASITITSFPTGANYLRVGTTYYTTAGSTCPPQISCTTWPGTLSVAITGGNITPAISVDPSFAGTGSVVIPFQAVDNAGIPSGSGSNVTLGFIAPATPITVSGNVWNDVNGDGINASPEVLTNVASAGETLYAVLVQTNNTYSGQPTVYEATAVSAASGYSFTSVPSGNNYEVRIVSAASAPGNGSAASLITPALATNYTATRTNNNGTISGLLNSQNPAIAFTNLTASAANANFGVEQRPTTGNTTLSGLANPGGFNPYTVTDASFIRSDADGGTVQSITIVAFPTGANYIRIGNTYYTGAGSTCPPQAVSCTAFPGAGVTIPITGGTLTQAITIDPAAAGTATVTIPYTALDNAGIASTPASNVTLNFNASAIAVSGNVWNDNNGDGINASPEVLTSAAGPSQTLYAVLIQTSNAYSGQPTIYEAVPVSSTTGYTFSNVASGSNYSVRIVSANTTTPPVAGALATTLPNALAPGYTATRTNNNGTISGFLNNQTPAISFTNLTASASAANFGVERLPTSTSANYTIPTPATNSTKSLTAANGMGALSGTDPEDITVGSGRTFIVNSLAGMNGKILLYNGSPVVANTPISNYDPALLAIQFSGTGTTASFTFSLSDIAGVYSASPATYTVNWSTPLPVKLISFEATALNDKVALNWTTAEEKDIADYTVQHSTDGRIWKKVATLSATGSGTYNTADINPANGINLYRLETAGNGGELSYSDVRKVAFGKISNAQISVFPNPVMNVLTVKADDNQARNISITDARGSIVANARMNGSAEINMTELSSGTYFVRVSADGEQPTIIKVQKK